MTTTASEVSFSLDGTGKATLNWGDGKSETVKLRGLWRFHPSNWNENLTNVEHSYSGTPTHTITICGQDVGYLSVQNSKLTSMDLSHNTVLYFLFCPDNQISVLDIGNNTELRQLYCSENQLTSFDVSKNRKLDVLSCRNNRLTSLDLSRNIALTNVIVSDNRMTADALNALFTSLHSNSIMGGNNFPVEKQIYIGGNPGIDDCDHKIAESKGWTVVSD